MDFLKKRIVELLIKWRKHLRSGVLWGLVGAMIFTVIGLALYISYCLRNPVRMDSGLVMTLVVIACIVGANFSVIFYGIFKQRIYRKCVDSLTEYNFEIQRYCVEKQLTKGGMKRVHYNPNNGIWLDEVIRSGLLSSNSGVHLETDCYLEGEASGQRFRFSNIELSASKELKTVIENENGFFGGKFWTLSTGRELSCRIIYVNKQLTNLMLSNQSILPWGCESQSFRQITPKDKTLLEGGICMCDDPNASDDVLTPDMESCIRKYMDEHQGEAFFIGYGNREAYFFDFAENETELVMDKKKGMLTASFKVSEYYDRMKEAYEESNKKGMELTKYLYEILELFQEEGVMWNQIPSDSYDKTINDFFDEVRRIRI